MIFIRNNLFTTKGGVINNSDSRTVQRKTKRLIIFTPLTIKGTRSRASLILNLGTRHSWWSNSCTSYFTPVEWTRSTHWDGPTASLGTCKSPSWEPCCTLTMLRFQAPSHICSTHAHTLNSRTTKWNLIKLYTRGFYEEFSSHFNFGYLGKNNTSLGNLNAYVCTSSTHGLHQGFSTKGPHVPKKSTSSGVLLSKT